MSGNRRGRAGVLLTLLLAPVALAAQRPPSLVLHHLRVGLDSATWSDVHASPFLRDQFSAFDSVRIETGGRAVLRHLFTGRRNWLEVVRGIGPASIELGLTTDDASAVTRLVAAWRQNGMTLDSATVVRPDGQHASPWYLRWAVSRGEGAMLDVELDAYHPLLYRRLAEWDSLPVDQQDRVRALRPHFASDRLFSEITGATLAIPVEEIRRLRGALRTGGAQVVDEGEGLVVMLADGVRLRFVPAWNQPGLRRLEFYLTRAVPANPIYRLGQHSRLRFGPGRVAAWDFDLP